MSEQGWVVLGLGLAGIAIQVVSAFFIVKVSVAVLEERFKGYREVIRTQIDGLSDLHKDNAEEIVRLRDWKHEQVGPFLQQHELRLGDHERRIVTLEDRVTTPREG